jgi:hypothetical protein
MELHAEEGSMTLDLTVEPAHPRAGEIVHFRVSVTDAEGGLFQIGVDPGDVRAGGSSGRMIVDCVAPKPDEPARERSPASDTRDFTYAYRVSGERHFSVTVTSNGCWRETREAELTGTLTVAAAAASSNGPHAPEATVFQDLDAALPGEVRMSIGALDRDGVVRRVIVDWGDGSTPSARDVPTGEGTCVNEPMMYPWSGDTHTLDHVYASAGTYTVTASIVSTGCDGKSAQSAAASGTATVEAGTA